LVILKKKVCIPELLHFFLHKLTKELFFLHKNKTKPSLKATKAISLVVKGETKTLTENILTFCPYKHFVYQRIFKGV
jgi:hypothetical protein